MNVRNRVLPLIAVAGVFVLVATSVVRLGAQQDTPADFTNAALAEVRNAQGQVVLSGKFAVSEDEEDENETERKAPLAPTSIDPDAAGEAEVEVSGTGNSRRQEVEFSVHNLAANTAYTFVIDGRVFTTATTDGRGRIALERNVPLPGASQTR